MTEADTGTIYPFVYARSLPFDLAHRDGASIRKDFLLRSLPPEWNGSALTERDFRRYCARDGIVVRELPLDKLPGCYLPRVARAADIRRHPRIILNDSLRGAEREFVAFHELGHHWLHSTDPRMSHDLGDQIEIEADIVAVCALIPQPALRRHCPDEIAEMYGYPPELVSFRREVFDHWGI